jgi:cytochrome c oxidase subunit II
LLCGCGGPQSALDPAGRGAERIADLFWWMAVGAGVIWLGIVGLAVYTIHLEREPHGLKGARLLIVVGGVVFPTIVLAALLSYGLALLPELVGRAPEGSLKIAVSGEQWWWRVRYLRPDGNGAAAELANEIRLPVGEPVEFQLESPDVIHSFWIPALGGKMDMIPGRTNRLTLEPTRTGVFRGVCAEFCGTSHALMGFDVVVLEKAEFAAWLARQTAPADAPAKLLARRGEERFLADGCGACHTIRGTAADGLIGPDLTHVGGRLSLGARVLANDPDGFRRWIAETEHVKPDSGMPSFGMLPPEDVDALAAYLDGLE